MSNEQFNLLDKDVLTTGEVAKICNVASRTVSKWFDSGQLKGYRIPARRIVGFRSATCSPSCGNMRSRWTV